MDARLEKLFITAIELSGNIYFAATDGQIESDLAQFDHSNLASIQTAISRALASYKDKVKRVELGLSLEYDE